MIHDSFGTDLGRAPRGERGLKSLSRPRSRFLRRRAPRGARGLKYGKAGLKYVTSLPNYTTDYFTIAMNELRKSTPWHEIGHMVEHLNPNALRISKEFIASRTAGETPTKLSQIFPGWNYRPNEVTRKDDFIDPYIGKEYQDASEVLSMGLEGVFSNSTFCKFVNAHGVYEYKLITDDAEFLRLILGMIAVV